MGEDPAGGHSYSQVLQLNQKLVQDLQGLIDDHEGKMKELAELHAAYEQARGQIGRLEDELRAAQAKDADLHLQVQQVEAERIDQLSAVGAHLDALRSALERYLPQGQHVEQKAA